ncbi:hypothetical protein GB931_21090 [Modestobacter sp. I12A-02628]|uniref:Integral membrane protein n=1 Tax=Goekera deserti TaxID=2497753 RepID=A0A7K3WG24_9ACTN|nr:DMT family transporter [Goekera deserti]MPR00370.1 hypothetical protein [Goekera deserti]NDI50427.1 hypothetical protein [Goekera deserti]NEL55306.1 hypothetical protein [Goekera deserti]
MIAAVLLALGSASAFAVSTVVQHRAASSVDSGQGAGRVLRLLQKLIRHPVWLAGQFAAVVGLTLHAFALHHGAVVLVQPLLSSGLVLSLVLGAVVDRLHPGRALPDRVQWAAAVVVVVGLGVFLLAAHPGEGRGATDLALGLCVAAAVGVALLAAVWALRPNAPHRALVLGIASGCGFGSTGLQLKALVEVDVDRWLVSWPFYALVLSGAVGITMAQWAYQTGALIESLPAMAVLEPLIAIGLAGPVFGESLALGAVARSGQLIGVVLLVGGVLVLARRSAGREQPELAAAAGGVVGASPFPTPPVHLPVERRRAG